MMKIIKQYVIKKRESKSLNQYFLSKKDSEQQKWKKKDYD